MGSGRWSPDTYQIRVGQLQAKGVDAFDYSSGATGVHPTLNPYGLEYRESRDSAEHPDSNSIIVGLDVSGSMGKVVRAIHKDLPRLLGLLLGQQYVPHPQIMFSAFSNGNCDPVPLQIGQFESDNRMDQNLENIILGGKLAGGCDTEYESAELLMYIAAHHTSIDCWEKRHRKGYLFLITDEKAYPEISADQVNKILGDHLAKDIELTDIIKEACERYHVFVLVPTQTQSGARPEVLEFWKASLDPQHVVPLENSDDVSETIALIIGLSERTIRLQDGLEHLKASGAGQQTIESLGRVLSMLDGDAVQGAGNALRDLDQGDQNKGVRRL